MSYFHLVPDGIVNELVEAVLVAGEIEALIDLGLRLLKSGLKPVYPGDHNFQLFLSLL